MSVPKPVFGSVPWVSANRTCLRSKLSAGSAGAAVGGSSTTRPRTFALSSRQRSPAGFARMNVAFAQAPTTLGGGATDGLHDASTSARTVSARFRR